MKVFVDTNNIVRHCCVVQTVLLMKSYLSLKPGATFFLGSSRTLVYHKDDVEIIYRHKMDGKKYRRDSNQPRPY